MSRSSRKARGAGGGGGARGGREDDGQREIDKKGELTLVITTRATMRCNDATMPYYRFDIGQMLRFAVL